MTYEEYIRQFQDQNAAYLRNVNTANTSDMVASNLRGLYSNLSSDPKLTYPKKIPKKITNEPLTEVESNLTNAAVSGTSKGGLKGLGQKLLGPISSNFGYSFRSPGATGWGSKATIGATKGPGLTAFGLPIGKYANIGNAVMQGVDAVQGISDYSQGQADINSLINDIKVSAMGNPLVNSYLTSDQLSLLNKLQRGTYDTDASMDDFMSGLTSGGFNGAVQGAMSGAIGGLPGMAIGAIGGLVNGGIDGLSNANAQTEAELQALLTALQNAEMQYKSMQRPNFTGLGIQQQYQDMYR